MYIALICQRKLYLYLLSCTSKEWNSLQLLTIDSTISWNFFFKVICIRSTYLPIYRFNTLMSVHVFFWAYLKKIINSKQDERSEHWIVKNHLFCFVCLNMITIIAFMNQLKHKIIDLTKKRRKKKEIPVFFILKIYTCTCFFNYDEQVIFFFISILNQYFFYFSGVSMWPL